MDNNHNSPNDCKKWTPIQDIEEDDKDLMIRCNWCDAVFEEKEIVVDEEGEEHCPMCKERGYLMNLEDALSEEEESRH